ncbi:TIGR04219 family outer membrane beta-barrel protein [Persephonella sp.]
MKKSIFSFLGIFSIFGVSQAVPMIEGEVSAGYIQQKPSGWVQYKGDQVDVKDDLKIGDEDSYFFRAKLEHPVPLLPNIAFQYVKMDFSGTGRITKSFRYGNKVVTVGDTVYSNIKMDHYDVTLFYNLPFVGLATAGILDIEFGLNVRVLDFKANVKTETSAIDETASVTAPIPMIYGAIEISPISLLSIKAEGKGVAYNGNSYYDLSGELRIKPITIPLAVDFFIGLGYKYERLKIDDIDDVSTDIKIKQPYVTAGLLF